MLPILLHPMPLLLSYVLYLTFYFLQAPFVFPSTTIPNSQQPSTGTPGQIPDYNRKDFLSCSLVLEATILLCDSTGLDRHGTASRTTLSVSTSLNLIYTLTITLSDSFFRSIYPFLCLPLPYSLSITESACTKK
jgi:hypothetical protein